MTRFLMNLDEAVDLVIFAFNNAKQGDLFVQKAPASTIITLAEALKELFGTDATIRTIGTRHGEKKHETLLTKEERIKADDLGDYFRVPADNRDLNYGKFLNEGDKSQSKINDYTSENTNQLDVEGVIKKLNTVEYIRAEIEGKIGELL